MNHAAGPVFLAKERGDAFFRAVLAQLQMTSRLDSLFTLNMLSLARFRMRLQPLLRQHYRAKERGDAFFVTVLSALAIIDLWSASTCLLRCTRTIFMFTVNIKMVLVHLAAVLVLLF